MVYIIVKKTQREREAGLAESRTRSIHRRDIDGVVRTTEEAAELGRQREREGLMNRPYLAVDAEAPESKQARAEELLRSGINPDTMQSLQSDSTRHNADHGGDIIGRTADGKPIRAADVG